MLGVFGQRSRRRSVHRRPAARLALFAVFGDDMDAITQKWLLIGIAATVASDNQYLALFFGKAADHFDDATVGCTGGNDLPTQQIELVFGRRRRLGTSMR